MTITVFGATGMVGQYIVRHALADSFKVIAFGRNIEKLIDEDLDDENLIAIKGYVFDEDDVYKALKDSDAVISALGGAFDGTDKTRSLGLKNIITQMERASVRRIVAIGGMGVLNANETTLIIDSPDYPSQYIPVGKQHLQAYKYLEASKLDWTFVCPPAIINSDSSNAYTTCENYHPSNTKNEVATGSIASFIINELIKNHFINKRVGIADIAQVKT